jgi:hypothetical protein
MVVSPSYDPEKIRARHHDPSPRLNNAHKFNQKALGIINVFKDIEGTHRGKGTLFKRKTLTIVYLASKASGLSLADVRKRDINTHCFHLVVEKRFHDLPNPTTDIQNPSLSLGTQ